MWSVIAGIGGGLAFYYIWRRILPRQRSRDFWQAIPVHATGMVRSEDPGDVLRHYRQLMRDAATFTARNSFAVAAALLPLAALFFLSAELHASGRRAPIVEVQPAAAVAGLPVSSAWAPTRDGGLEFDRRKYDRLKLFGRTLDHDALADKRAFCGGWLACLGYELMLFETHPLPRNASSVVMRPRVFDANPWWPQVDDLELAFFASAAAGALAASWLASRRSSPLR